MSDKCQVILEPLDLLVISTIKMSNKLSASNITPLNVSIKKNLYYTNRNRTKSLFISTVQSISLFTHYRLTELKTFTTKY